MYKTTLPLVILLILIINLCEINGSKKNILRQTKFPPCKACKIFIESFKRGVEKTAKGKFEGGDTAWEEEKLGSYATSEVRLVEIQEKVCSDIEEGQDQCYSLHEEYDNDIEDWWLNHQEDSPDLFEYFCVEKLKYCCPDFHYGPNCSQCPGFPDKICSNNGKCKGSGTRKGNGKCICDHGYLGENCSVCDENYFESYKDENKILCSPCPKSCEGRCTITGCEKCSVGWIKGTKGDCLDVNECAMTTNPACGPLQFCVNTEGSFKCLECDKSCAGCTGDGPDMCIRCAKGFNLNGNMCVDEGQEERSQHIYFTRILTYVGLCIATCIIYQKNIMTAAIIGLAVALYITVSEYVLNSLPLPDSINITDKLFQQK